MLKDIVREIKKRSLLAVILNEYPEEYHLLNQGVIIETAKLEDLKDFLHYLNSKEEYGI